MRKPNKQEIADLCIQYHIKLLVLFGSMATGDKQKNSDIDLAALFLKPVSAKYELEFFYKLVSLFETDRIDFVALKKANPLILKEVALYGTPLYENKAHVFDEFIILAMAKYQATKANRQYEKQLVEEYLEKRKT